MARTILIKFCGFIAHSKPNNMILSAFFRKKYLKLEKEYFIFCPSPNVAPKLHDQSLYIGNLRSPYQYLQHDFLHFWSSLKIKKSSHKEKI